MKEQDKISSDKVISAVQDSPAELPVLPLSFIQVNDYTTFRAEFAITEGDIVYHFFITAEINGLVNPRRYWDELFPSKLQDVAREYFKADFPRLQAQYIPEMASWWFRAKGYGAKLDPHRFSYRFFDLFDEALEGEMAKAT